MGLKHCSIPHQLEFLWTHKITWAYIALWCCSMGLNSSYPEAFYKNSHQASIYGIKPVKYSQRSTRTWFDVFQMIPYISEYNFDYVHEIQNVLRRLIWFSGNCWISSGFDPHKFNVFRPRQEPLTGFRQRTINQ